MNTTEELLWDYLDGRCMPEIKLKIETRLLTDDEFRRSYEELSSLHHTLQGMESDEPSMSFSRNVMDRVLLEPAPVTMKTHVDRRIIYGIGLILTAGLVAMLGYAIANSNWDRESYISIPKVSMNWGKYINSGSITAFLFVDVAIGLLYIDSLLRKGKINSQKKGV